MVISTYSWGKELRGSPLKRFAICSFREFAFDWGYQAYLAWPESKAEGGTVCSVMKPEGEKPRQRHPGTLQVTSGRAGAQRIMDQWMKYSKKDDGKAEGNQCTQSSDLLHFPSPPWRDWDSLNVTTAKTVLVGTGEEGDDSFVGCRKSWWFCLWQQVKTSVYIAETSMWHPFHFLPHLVSLYKSLF